MMKRIESILLVEDEVTLAHGLEYNLSSEGYSVTVAGNGKDALNLFRSKKFDLVILDIMLPYVDGFDIAEHIRTNDQQLPILFLTARTGIKDRIKGLELGADDYMTKPFHLEELILKVKGMLRRKNWYHEFSEVQSVYQFGNNEINFENLIGKNSEKKIQLTLHETMLLKYLIEHKGTAVSRNELLDKVWNISSEIETRTVDNFIVRLRKYFETDPDNPVYIKSVRGVGYIFSDPSEKG
jgi:two-component system, OmpR family, alkaline phosphatase synthesis response regulator PhoP